MGIRIHKVLGWVLEGEKVDLEILESITLEDLKTEHPKNYALSMDLYSTLNLKSPLINFVVDASEEEDKNDKTFVFIPPISEDKWQRYDSPIDYYECQTGERIVKYLPYEIFPYAQKFVVAKNLNVLTEKQKDICRMFSTMSSNLRPEVSKDLESLGIDLNEPLLEQIYMTAPEILKLILQKTNPEVDYRRLRPAIVTYWK